MLRRSRYIPALAVAVCGLLAAACSLGQPGSGSARAEIAPVTAGNGPVEGGEPPTDPQARPGPGGSAPPTRACTGA